MKPGSDYKKRRKPASGSRFLIVLGLLAVSLSWFFSPAAIAGETVRPEQIILTWTADPTTSQTITWLAPNNSLAQVQYSPASEYNGNFDSALQLYTSGVAFDSINYRYTANLFGLTPDTGYIYRVGNEGAWSQALSFTTAANTENFSFLYLGDTQAGYIESAYAELGSMLNSVYQSNSQIKFSLLGGDLTDNDIDATEWGQFLDAATGVFSRIPMMPTLGNHDGYMYMNFFTLPGNGPDGFKQEFYSFDYGNAHFVVLNSGKNTYATVKQWLHEDLQATTKKWKFAVFHHPAYPAFDDYKTIDESICANWVPILEENGVDMVFVGHQHEYMRTYPIFQGQIQTNPEGYGIVYIMGSAGSKAYSAGADFDYIAREETGSNYQLINIEGDVLTMTSKKASGELIESYIIDKSVPAKPVYLLSPQENASYTAETFEGINTMTVNTGVSGFKYFPVNITPVTSHTGSEAVVFTHLRNNSQISINVTKADFDLVSTAQAGFNVQAGDVIKVYIVDDLTNALDCNPVIFQ